MDIHLELTGATVLKNHIRLHLSLAKASSKNPLLLGLKKMIRQENTIHP